MTRCPQCWCQHIVLADPDDTNSPDKCYNCGLEGPPRSFQAATPSPADQRAWDTENAATRDSRIWGNMSEAQFDTDRPTQR